MKTICPICKGRGYIFNPMSILLTVGLPIALLIGSELTRQDCETCNGEGKINLDKD